MSSKKFLLILGIFLILTILIMVLLFVFMGLYNSSQNQATTSASSVENIDPVSYIKESWQFTDAQWDRSTNTITAIRTYDLTREDAEKIGSRVFTEDLAPDSYLTEALTIAADLSSRFSMGDVKVVISFRGNDSQELFSVDSLGEITTCWEIPAE